MKYSSLAFGALAGGVFLFGACKPQPANINLSTDNLQLLEKGATGPVTAEVLNKDGAKMDGVAVNWKSSDDKIASVDANGTISAVGSGEATITASVEALTKDVKVTVSLPSAIDVGGKTQVSLTPEAPSVTLTANIVDEKGGKWAGQGDITWASDNQDMAAVEYGVITGMGTGAAKVTGTFKDLTVTVAVDSSVTDKAAAMTAHNAALAAIGKTSALAPAAPADANAAAPAAAPAGDAAAPAAAPAAGEAAPATK